MPHCAILAVRKPTKPSTAHCDIDIYTAFLLAEPKHSGCNRLASVMGLNLSHDSVNRFLLRESYEPKDLFAALLPSIEPTGGVLSGDDTVMEKPYSSVKSTELAIYCWSNKEHRVLRGIPLITLYYTDPQGIRVPVNYRIYDKREGKTKNAYLREMVAEVLSWGLAPATLTTDAWYASRQNLRFLRDQNLKILMGIAKNRLVSVNGQPYVQVQTLTIPPQGLLVHLKGFGTVKVFCQSFPNGVLRYYLVWCPSAKDLKAFSFEAFEELRQLHWGIECFHRAIKQLCGLTRFRVRTTEAIVTHVFCSLRAFCELSLACFNGQLGNLYELQWTLHMQAVRQFICEQFQPQLSLAHS